MLSRLPFVLCSALLVSSLLAGVQAVDAPAVTQENKKDQTPAVLALTAAEQKLPATYFAELADLKQRYGMPEEASAYLKLAIERSTEPALTLQYKLALADILSAKGDAAAALKTWEEIAASPDAFAASKANLRLAQQLAATGKGDEALKRFETIALNSAAGNYREAAIKALVPLLKASGKTAEKLQEYHTRLLQNTRDRQLRDLVLAMQENDLEGRVQTLAELLKAAPRDLELQRDYGTALIAAGKLDEAAKHYEQLRRDYPSEGQIALQNLATIYIRKGTPEAASQALLESGTAIKDNVQRDLYYARQAMQLKLYALAEKHARQASAETKSDGFKLSAEMELGEALLNLGKKDEARTVLTPLANQEVYSGLKIRAATLLSRLGVEK